MKKPDWISKLSPYAKSDSYRAFLFAASSIGPYLILFGIMIIILTGGYPYWIVLLLSLFAAGFYVRTFMILHDCSHNSFLLSRKNSFILAHICGVLTFTPFFDWQRKHGIHHANVSNLDKRGIGDVWTMTVKEYYDSNTSRRLAYRFFRNPVFLFLIAPIFLFLVMYRFPIQSKRKKDYFSIIFTNVILILIIISAYFTVGIKNYILVQLPILFIGTSGGMWLFYIQHQFRNVYWAHNEDWNLTNGAMKGSSFYNLPSVLRWFSGNIGYHNIHHLNPGIPCYNLKQCYDELSDLHYTVPITLLSGFHSLRLHLWDEELKKLISFKEASLKIKSTNH